MVHVDTSVLVPLFLNEPHNMAAAEWYAREKRELVAAHAADRRIGRPWHRLSSGRWRKRAASTCLVAATGDHD
jgi:hypothetical protein